jgi:hypothetical protein
VTDFFSVLQSCQIPECETDTAEYYADKEFLQNAVPFEKGVPARCQRFAFDENLYANVTSGEEICSFRQFDRKSIIECDKFIYENDEKTIVNEVRYFYLELNLVTA